MPRDPKQSIASVIIREAHLEDVLCTPKTLVVDADTMAQTDGLSNVFLIQKAISLMNRSSDVVLQWDDEPFKLFVQAPNSYPLLACFILHSNITHIANNPTFAFPLKSIRSTIHLARVKFDWFSEPKALLCADHLGLGRQRELYASEAATSIRPREDFEALVFPYVEALLAVDVNEQNIFRWREAFTSVIYELFENTDLHGRTDETGLVLETSIRGILFKEVLVPPYQPVRGKTPNLIRCLEISIFDGGVGYFSKRTQTRITDDVPIKDEWTAMHLCLSTHLEFSGAIQVGKGQHGIGLYEVLRALKFLNGAIEFRTGRLHAYRSFFPGDLTLQMESNDSNRPNMPKPVLLDYQEKYIPKPTQQPEVVGTAVRVLVPIR